MENKKGGSWWGAALVKRGSLRLWSVGCGGGEFGLRDVVGWDLTFEGLEEGDDGGAFFVGDDFSELVFGHHFDHGGEVFDGTIMEVRAGFGGVAKAGDLEHELVRFRLGVGGTTFVLEVGPSFDEAEFLIHVATDAGAVVAGDATGFGEVFEAFLFVGGKGVFLALEEVVPAGRRHQFAFEGTDGFAEVVVGDGVGVAREGGFEGVDITGHGFEDLDHEVGVGHAHFDGVQNGTFGLFFDGGSAAIPELGDVDGGVEGGRGATAAEFAVVTGGEGEVVLTEAVEFVTGVAGDFLALGNAILIVEHAAEVDFGVGEFVIGSRGFCRKRGEHGLVGIQHGLGEAFGSQGEGDRGDEECAGERKTHGFKSLLGERVTRGVNYEDAFLFVQVWKRWEGGWNCGWYEGFVIDDEVARARMKG